LLAELGTDHLFPAKRIAIAAIFERLDRGICETCRIRVFEECQGLPPPLPVPSSR
jgi:SulP family sulfate permease